MENIPLAKKITFHPDTEKNVKNKGYFTIEPLFPGYGLTVGNVLRRVLLSSLSGAAIVAVKINGVSHEFSTVDWIKEDVLDIILNLKQIRIKADENLVFPLKLTLDVKGEKEVTAGDFEKVAGIEIMNPDQKIATLTDHAARFEMEVNVDHGRGYLPTEGREEKNYEVNTMMVDAIFTPIKRVGYDIENVRVLQMTNWDKLILKIETDGTITCEDAFKQAVNIILEQFSGLLNKEIAKNTQQQTVETNIADAAEDELADADETDAEEKPKKRGRKKKDDA